MKSSRELTRRYRFPTVDCPAWGAKHILFARDTTAKNETVLVELEQCGTVDYAVRCPKYKKLIGVKRFTGMEDVPVCFRTVGCTTIAFSEVLNHRLLAEKNESYDFPLEKENITAKIREGVFPAAQH